MQEIRVSIKFFGLLIGIMLDNDTKFKIKIWVFPQFSLKILKSDRLYPNSSSEAGFLVLNIRVKAYSDFKPRETSKKK